MLTRSKTRQLLSELEFTPLKNSNGTPFNSSTKLPVTISNDAPNERAILNLHGYNFDFDYSSECWKANKKSVGNGCYSYICGFELKNGGVCKRTPLKCSDFCSLHHTKNKK